MCSSDLKRVAVGDAKTLATRRADALTHFTKLGVDRQRILASVGAKAVEDIGLEHLETLIGFATAIRDGDASIDETFPPIQEAAPAPSFAKAEPSDAPPGAEAPAVTTEPPKPVQTPAARDVKTLRLFLKQSGHDEATLLQLWRESGVVDESLASLEEVAEIKPSAIRTACEPWGKTLAALNARKAANQPAATEGGDK